MKAIEQHFHVVLFNYAVKGGSYFWDAVLKGVLTSKSCVTIQYQYFHVALFIMLYKVVLTSKH